MDVIFYLGIKEKGREDQGDLSDRLMFEQKCEWSKETRLEGYLGEAKVRQKD